MTDPDGQRTSQGFPPDLSLVFRKGSKPTLTQVRSEQLVTIGFQLIRYFHWLTAYFWVPIEGQIRTSRERTSYFLPTTLS